MILRRIRILLCETSLLETTISTIKYLHKHSGCDMSSVTYHLSISHIHISYMYFLNRSLIATATDCLEWCFHWACQEPNRPSWPEHFEYWLGIRSHRMDVCSLSTDSAWFVLDNRITTSLSHPGLISRSSGCIIELSFHVWTWLRM